MTEPFRLAIAGVSHWHAPRHIEAFREAGASIVAVQDADPVAREQWASTLGCPAYSSAEEMFAAVMPDLVLAMPRHSEAPELLDMLVGRALPFLLEKPGAARAADLLPYLEEVEVTGQFAAVAFINRYGEFWTELGRRRLAGDPVTPIAARFRIVNGPPQRYRKDGVDWVLDPAVSGGGPMRNIGSHAVDAFLALAVGDVTVEGASTTSKEYGLAIEDHAIAILRDETGFIGIVEAGYTRPDDDGTDQEWLVAAPGLYLRETHDLLEISEADGIRTLTSPTVAERYAICAVDTMHRLGAGLTPIATLRDAWRASGVVDEIYRVAAAARYPTPNKEFVQR